VTSVTSLSRADRGVSQQTTPVGSRSAKPSRLRRLSRIVLVSGTLLALAAAFGPTWLVRFGVGVAVVAAVLACVFAWRELFSAERRHASEQLSASRAHGATLREERSRNGAVVDTLSRRINEVSAVVEGQEHVIGTLRAEIVTVTTDRDRLRRDVAQRDMVITSLRHTVRSQEAELIALLDDSGADVHHLPRRVLAEHESSWPELPEAAELWHDGSHPAVVDLKMVETAMVLPNYEMDRQVG
jgi:hypothetical protein